MVKSKKQGAAKKIGSARRGKAKPETKDEQVETSTGVQLLLGNLPPDKDAKYAYETLSILMAKSKSAAKRVGDQKAKMREAGLDVDAFVETMRLEKMDPLDLANYFKELSRLASVRGLPVQMQLYEPKYGSVEDQAHAEGLAAGRAARNPDTQRWPEGGQGHESHMKGWNEGQQENAEKIKKTGGHYEKDDEDE